MRCINENQEIATMVNDLTAKQKLIMEDHSLDMMWKQKANLEYKLDRKFIDQEVHWIQRAKQDWLLLGDMNTNFF